MPISQITWTVIVVALFLMWIQPRELGPAWNAKPLPPEEPKYQRSVMGRQFLARVRGAVAVVAIAMLSAVIALELLPPATSSNPEPALDLGRWVGTNLAFLVWLLGYLWFDFVIRVSWSLWRLSQRDTKTFTERSRFLSVGLGLPAASQR